MKKIISIILALTILCSISLCSWISSYATTKKGDFEYTVLKNGTAKIKYKGKSKKLVIPETIDGYKVTYFDQNFNENITSLSVPSTLKTIGRAAFWNCDKLETINLENGIENIGQWAFEGCTKLSQITLPKSVKKIGHGAFESCTKLSEIIIPSKVKAIGENAFSSCTSLKKVTIENGVQTICRKAFWDCRKLSEINIPDSVSNIGEFAFDATKWYENQPDGMVFAGKNLYDYKGTCPTKTTIPDGTKSICFQAFSEQRKLCEVIIPDSVIRIKNCAFMSCENLESVSLGNNIKSIGHKAFAYCDKLTDFTIPDSVIKLGYEVFRLCENLKTVTIGKGLEKFVYGYYSSTIFSECFNLQKITVDKDNKYFSSKDGVLFNKKQTELIVYPNKKSTSYSIPKGVKTIGKWSFYYCDNLKKITIPKGIEEIGIYAFYRTSISKITLPNSLKTIKEGAFYGNKNLKSLTIPKNVKKIGGIAFANCKKLKKVNFNATNCKLALYEYEWDTDHSWIFKDNKKLKTISIGKSVKQIPKDLFYDVIDLNLKKVTVSKKAKIISYKTFNHSDKEWVAISSSNRNAIRVSKKGNMTLYGKGSTKITFKNQENNKTKKVTFVVT